MIRLIIEIEVTDKGMGLHTSPEIHQLPEKSDEDKKAELMISSYITNKLSDLANNICERVIAKSPGAQSVHIDRPLGDPESPLVASMKNRLRGKE